MLLRPGDRLVSSPHTMPPATGNSHQIATCTSLPDGTAICKRFNDNRGCTGDDNPKCGGVHVCDVVLAVTGNACGGTDHKRQEHNSDEHGLPSFRMLE